jgi:hypothetical protein
MGRWDQNGSSGDWLGGCGLDSTGSGQGPVAGCCECGDETSGSCATELVSYIDVVFFSFSAGVDIVYWIRAQPLSEVKQPTDTIARAMVSLQDPRAVQTDKRNGTFMIPLLTWTRGWSEVADAQMCISAWWEEMCWGAEKLAPDICILVAVPQLGESAGGASVNETLAGSNCLPDSALKFPEISTR